MIWLRSAAFNLWFYGFTVLVALASVPLLLLPPAVTRWVAYVWSRGVLGGLWICGISIRVTGRENIPPGPALIASQHQSAMDTIVWFHLVPEVTYVLKAELNRIPIYGAISRRLNMIAVDRKAGAQAMRVLFRGADEAIAAGRQIVIFPEGSRAAPGTVLPLHPGVAGLASRTGLPVIPVATDSGRHWGRRAFRRLPGVIRIDIRPPLPARLPRAELLHRLAAIYAQGPVDNSVGEGESPLTAHPRNIG